MERAIVTEGDMSEGTGSKVSDRQGEWKVKIV